jgi:hypothetical protein
LHTNEDWADRREVARRRTGKLEAEGACLVSSKMRVAERVASRSTRCFLNSSLLVHFAFISNFGHCMKPPAQEEDMEEDYDAEEENKIINEVCPPLLGRFPMTLTRFPHLFIVGIQNLVDVPLSMNEPCFS